ncbi:MAG TPA: hypothetical protein VFO57_03925 [Burkholderiales bacterium]|nr:hypothetical protein [Burkholderiales bacterium]
MRIGLDRPEHLAPLLWALLALFAARVTGQALVAFLNVRFLPPMQEWYSGLMPYEYLLPAQIAIIALMTKICLDFTKGRGFFVEPRRFFSVYWLNFGYLYLAAMVLRYPVRMILHPEARWLGGTLPIFFHWVLAVFVIGVGLYHRRHKP